MSSPSASIRLQKYLAACGVCSRRKAEELITEGKVKVNQKVVTELGTKIHPIHDQVRVRNRIVRPPERGMLIFHKPKGVLCTMDDPKGRPTVADYLTKKYQSYFPVGRLDWDSTGLVILTNDGELAHHLLHPKFGCKRVYEVKVSGHVSERTMERLERGVRIDGRPVKSEVLHLKDGADHTWLRLSVYEGRKHLIKRLMAKVRHPVQKLKRTQHGPVRLGKLRVGEIRPLSHSEFGKVLKEIP